MISPDIFQQLVRLLGSEEKAKEAIRLLDRRITSKKLSPMQQRVYDYLLEDGMVVTQRQLAEACGLDHPQKLAAICAALVVKGYLVPAQKNVLDKEANKA